MADERPEPGRQALGSEARRDRRTNAVTFQERRYERRVDHHVVVTLVVPTP